MPNLYCSQLHAHLETEDNRAEWKHGVNTHRSWTYLRDSSFSQKRSSEVKEIKQRARLFLHAEVCDVRSTHSASEFGYWGWCCWSDRVEDASDSPQTPGSPSGEQPATHAAVTHRGWQRRRVRARRCSGNIITKTILGWHLPPLLWRKMGENKHSKPEK